MAVVNVGSPVGLLQKILLIDPVGSGQHYDADPSGELVYGQNRRITLTKDGDMFKFVPVLEWENPEQADEILVKMLLRAAKMGARGRLSRIPAQRIANFLWRWGAKAVICRPEDAKAIKGKMKGKVFSEMKLIGTQLVPRATFLLTKDPENTGVSPSKGNLIGLSVFPDGVTGLVRTTSWSRKE